MVCAAPAPGVCAGAPALRRRRTVPAPAPAATGPVVELLEHLVPFPSAADGALLLTFSNPLPALSEPLLELFDAVAASLRFVHPGGAR